MLRAGAKAEAMGLSSESSRATEAAIAVRRELDAAPRRITHIISPFYPSKLRECCRCDELTDLPFHQCCCERPDSGMEEMLEGTDFCRSCIRKDQHGRDLIYYPMQVPCIWVCRCCKASNSMMGILTGMYPECCANPAIHATYDQFGAVSM